ncbi:hypothetical protein EV356DRAFT_548029 [Viridothelium virens]|uniref:Uncharacterized protein n=1 Tax=Viridothelium virens TaxID=1048519 RepID=A0A6A6H5K1_VIRVR|nr:hypothetical protein EV356DRAFT_548029 [Viridothelium virens]
MEGPIKQKDVENFEEVPLDDEEGAHYGTLSPSYEDSQSSAFWDVVNPRKIWVESPGSGRLVLAVGFFLMLCALALIVGAPIYVMLHPDPTTPNPSDPNSAANKISMLLPRGDSFFVSHSYFEETVCSTHSPIETAVLPQAASLVRIPEIKVVSDGNAAAKRDGKIQESGFERAGNGDGDIERFETSQGFEKQSKERTNKLKSRPSNGKPHKEVGLAAIVIAVGSSLLGVTFVVLGALVCYLERKEKRDISNV